MAAGFRAQATAGNGQSSATSSVTVTIPASAQVGDDAVISVIALPYNDTLTVPSGWALLSGPDPVGLGAESWLLRKTLVTGDPGSVVTLAVTFSSRIEAVLVVGSGTTPTGLQFVSVVESTATTAPKLPALSSVPAGSLVVGFLNRRYAGAPSPTLGAASGFTAGPVSATAFGNSPNLTSLGMWQVASSAGTFGGGAASSAQATTGINYLVAFRPSGAASNVSVTAVAATATALASSNVKVLSGKIVNAVVATATASAAAPSLIQLLPSNSSGLWPPDPYRAVIRSGGYKLWYSAKATYSSAPVTGAQDMRPVGGTITDTTKPGVRRTLNLDLAPEPGLYDLLAPVGTVLTVTAHVQYLNGQVQDIPMGVFDIDQQSLEEGGGKLSLTAPDKWVRIQRAGFVGPASSSVGIPVVDQIAALIRGALGAAEPVVVTSKSTVTVGALTWSGDRAQAIIDLATDAGVWVFFDRNGVATIADLPTAAASADWLVDASPSGVLASLSRQQSRTATHNLVVVESSSAADQAFPTQYVWDSDPTSPTYAGPDPINHPELAGPFGVSVYVLPIAQPMTAGQAQQAGAAVLARVVGVAAQVAATHPHNPAMDSFASLDVLGPKVRYDIARSLERHVVDTVTHPLDVTQAMQISGRSTRTDAYS